MSCKSCSLRCPENKCNIRRNLYGEHCGVKVGVVGVTLSTLICGGAGFAGLVRGGICGRGPGIRFGGCSA